MSTSKYKHLEKVREIIEACYRCGDCRIQFRPAVGRYQVCPVYEAVPGKWEPFFARGKILLANGLLKGEIEPSQELADMLFQCMICGSCKSSCNASYHPSLNHPLSQIMDQPKVWEALRAELMEAGFIIPKHAEIFENCEKFNNPYAEAHEGRINWIPENKVFPEQAENILFMGCTEPYRMPKVLQNITEILDYAQVDYTVLGLDEWCCGSIALRTGNQELAHKFATHNYKAFQKAKATRIITHCAGCYRTLKQDYPALIPEFDFNIVHITEFIQELIEKGALNLTRSVNKKVTYHDPCHLGRHMQIYDAPRYILNHIPGLEFIEMQRIKENAWCCGAGAGVKSGFPDLALDIAKQRIREAVETGADTIVTTCPFCLRNLEDAAKALGSECAIEVLDLLELVLLALEK